MNLEYITTMDQEARRLELLKLTYTNGREASEAVERAKVLEEYLLENDTAKRPTVKKPSGKRPPPHLRKQGDGNS